MSSQRWLRPLASRLRFGQFVSVGVVGAIFDNAMLALLTAGLGVTPELAKLAGIETAIVVMFLVNDNWTFAEEGAEGLVAGARRLATSNVVRAGGIAVQLVVFSAMYRLVPVSVVVRGLGRELDLWLFVASGTGILAGLLVNYVTESLVTWRIHDPR